MLTIYSILTIYSMQAMLTVCEDETLVSFVKAGLKVRQCYLSFKECFSILQQRSVPISGLKVRQCYLSFKECFSILQQRSVVSGSGAS